MYEFQESGTGIWPAFGMDEALSAGLNSWEAAQEEEPKQS